MLDTSTFYLLLAMGVFVLVAVTLVHHHNSSYAIKKKQNEFDSISNQLNPRIATLEQNVVDLQIKSDELEVEIDTMKS